MLPLECPNSVVLQFPEEVYKNTGSSVVLPHLLEVLDVEKLTTVQFLQRRRVRLMFSDSVSCDNLVAQGLSYGDVQLRVFRADSRVCSVFLRDLPSEVPDDVFSFFSSFGDVLSVRRSTFANFPSVCNCNRVVDSQIRGLPVDCSLIEVESLSALQAAHAFWRLFKIFNF